jgi:hypothetical protein
MAESNAPRVFDLSRARTCAPQGARPCASALRCVRLSGTPLPTVDAPVLPPALRLLVSFFFPSLFYGDEIFLRYSIMWSAVIFVESSVL